MGFGGGSAPTPPPPPPPLPPPPNMSSADIVNAQASTRARANAIGSFGGTNPTGGAGVAGGPLERKSLLGS
jgi:hypothetical protein